MHAHLSDLNLAGLATVAVLIGIPVFAAAAERRQGQQEERRRRLELDRMLVAEAYRVIEAQVREEVRR